MNFLKIHNVPVFGCYKIMSRDIDQWIDIVIMEEWKSEMLHFIVKV